MESPLPTSRPTKEKSNRFSQARLSRIAQKRDKASQDKARIRMFKRRKNWEQEQARLNFPVFLRKFCELLLLSCLIGSVVAYNLQLGAVERSAEWMNKFASLLRFWNNGENISAESSLGIRFLHDLNYLFEANLPVLELKSTVWLMLGSLMVVVHLGARIFERVVGRRVFANDLSHSTKKLDKRRLFVLCSIFGFIGWSLLSFSPMGWGPVIPAEAPLLPQEFASQSGGMFNSFVAWLQVLLGVLFFISAEDLIRTRRFVYKLLGCMIGLAVIVTLLAIMLQARDTYFTFLNTFWITWGADEVRNDLGSLIGHNTAISSFLMAPFLIIWAILMSHQGELKRRYVFLFILALSLFSLVLLMAQSRAAVPILLLMFTYLVVMLARRANLKPSMSYLVGLPLVLILLLITQLIPKDQNPFFRRSVSLEQRISHLSFSHLQTETRLRILFATVPALVKKPVTGYGFHSFPYAYPEVQGEYFTSVLNKEELDRSSFFAPTPKKSMHAHNEYLQTFFETGLVGFSLAMLALGGILWGGWRVLNKSLRQRHVALQLGVFSGIIALLLHAGADFPFRVAPLACLLLVLLAIWSAGDRLWFIRVASLEERPLNDTESDLREKELLKKENALKMPVERLALWGLVFGILLFVVVVLHTFALQWFSGQMMNNSARKLAGYYQSNRSKMSENDKSRLLDLCITRLERAHDLTPLNGETLFQLATVRYYSVSELKQKLNEAQREGNTKAIQFYSMQIRTVLDQAIEEARRSLTEENYHSIYQLLGLLDYEAYQLNARNPEILERAFNHIRHSINLNPGEPNSIFTMISWLTKFKPEERLEIVQLINRLRIFFGGLEDSPRSIYNDFIFDYVLNMLEIGSFETGYQRMTLLQEVEPENPRFVLSLANAALLSNRFEEALLLNRTLPIKDNPHARIFRGFVSLKRHQWEAALEDLQQDRNENKSLPDQVNKKLQVIRTLLPAAAASTEESTAAWNSVVLEIEAQPRGQKILLESAKSLLMDFDLPERSIQFFLRYKETGGDLDHLDLAVLAQAYRFKNQRHIAEMETKIVEANKKGTSKDQLPSITNPSVREELLHANELDLAAIKGFRLYGETNQYIYEEINQRVQKTKFILGEL